MPLTPATHDLIGTRELAAMKASAWLINIGRGPVVDEDALIAAPDFAGISEWINSKPLTLRRLRGKVVLVDFWTYSCINCLRTLPYLKAWDARYRSKGLVILGLVLGAAVTLSSVGAGASTQP